MGAVELRFAREAVDHGVDDYESGEGDGFTLAGFAGAVRVCWIDYEERDDYLHVRWVETASAFRGQGCASRLLDEVERLHPGCALFTADFTEDGEVLRGRIHEDDGYED